MVMPSQREAEKQRLDDTVKAERRISIVVNTRSRRGKKLFDEACERFKAVGFTLDAAHAVPDPKQLDTRVCEVIASGATLVAVGGGDGTVSSVSRHFIGKPTVFGVLPLGTANSFARTLGIPQDLAGAIDVLAGGRVADVDLGCVSDVDSGSADGHYFTNAAAIGLPALIGETVPHGLKAALGRVGYLGWAAYQLLRLRPFECTLIEDGVERRYSALEVRISNGSYLGGLEVAEEASVNSRDLTIQIITGRSGWQLAKSWMMSAAGRGGGANLVSLRTRGLRIVTEPVMSVSIDGEVLAKTPVDVSVARQVLKIMVPADATP